jgi:RimJ/RimL family protein N-acetyltransferase
MSTIEIVTERLSLRPFQGADLEAFVAYRSDPEVARYQSWDRTYSMADAETFLSSQRELAFGQPGEWLQLAIVDRATGGVCAGIALSGSRPTSLRPPRSESRWRGQVREGASRPRR